MNEKEYEKVRMQSIAGMDQMLSALDDLADDYQELSLKIVNGEKLTEKEEALTLSSVHALTAIIFHKRAERSRSNRLGLED